MPDKQNTISNKSGGRKPERKQPTAADKSTFSEWGAAIESNCQDAENFASYTAGNEKTIAKCGIELLKLLAAKGFDLAEIGQHIGITDKSLLVRLPVVSVATASEFQGMSRQNLHRIMKDGNFPIGVKMDGQYLFSVQELAIFRVIPRRPGPQKKG